jgi:hypothetical protein
MSSPPSPNSLSARFLVGARREPIIVQVSIEHRGVDLERALLHLMMEISLRRQPRFPITIERGRARIALAGRRQLFTTYMGKGRAVAVADVDGFSIMIRCSVARLRTLAFVPLSRDELKKALDAHEAS